MYRNQHKIYQKKIEKEKLLIIKRYIKKINMKVKAWEDILINPFAEK